MRRSFMKLGALVAMMGVIGAPAAGMASRIAAYHTQDAINAKGEKPSPTAEKKIGMGRQGYRRPKTDFTGNQRQYRKKMRQNPCRYSSKKHRANN